MAARRRPRSSLLAQQPQLVSSKSKKAGSAARQGGASASRSNASRQAKTAAARGLGHGYAGADGLTVEEREAERQAREAERERRRKERRLDELERGTASSGALSEHHVSNVLPASTSAAAIAGLLAGQQQKDRDKFDDFAQAPGSSTAQSKKQSAELRRILTHRRGLRPLLEDAAANALFRSAPVNYVTAVTNVARSYPAHRGLGPLCSVCGYWGDARCVRCGERLCGRKCIATHDETRCERPQ